MDRRDGEQHITEMVRAEEQNPLGRIFRLVLWQRQGSGGSQRCTAQPVLERDGVKRLRHAAVTQDECFTIALIQDQFPCRC
jgi:hypothetical protein